MESVSIIIVIIIIIITITITIIISEPTTTSYITANRCTSQRLKVFCDMTQSCWMSGLWHFIFSVN